MKVIWKYVIGGPLFSLEMPSGARVLSVQEQFGKVTLWAEVDPASRYTTTRRTFRTVATGEGYDPEGLTFIGTVRIWSLVWHVFELVA